MNIKIKKLIAGLLVCSLVCAPATTCGLETESTKCPTQDFVCQKIEYFTNLINNNYKPANPYNGYDLNSLKKMIKSNMEVLDKLKENQIAAGAFYNSDQVNQFLLNNVTRKAVSTSSLIKNFFSSIITNPLLTFGVISWTIPFIRFLFGQGKAAVKKATIQKPKTAIEALNEYNATMSSVKGQERAIAVLRDVAVSTVDARLGFNKKLGKAGPGAVAYTLTGPSGCGKSMAASLFAKVIDGVKSEPFVMSATNLFSNRGHAFGWMYGRGAQGSETRQPSQLLYKVITEKQCIIIINEVDKLPDDQRKKFEEIIRGILDESSLYLEGYGMVDFSGVTFIFTSNESVQSYTKGNHEELQFKDDGTGSRTYIEHDKSYVNRVKFIEFDKLDIKAYENIIVQLLMPILERFHTAYGVNLLCSAMINDLAQHVDSMNQGARPIHQYINTLRSKVISKIVVNKNPEEQMNVLVLFNSAIDYEFVLVKINEAGQPDLSQNTPEERDFILTKLQLLSPRSSEEVPSNTSETSEDAKSELSQTIADTAAENEIVVE